MEIKISFIIPVYNEECAVRNAAASILKEREIPIELLIVDDGSTDATGSVCDAIAGEDSRVTVFHTKNQGQGLARNIGIKRAAGEYMFFCDADDLVIWEGIRRLLEVADSGHFDVVCGLYYCTENGRRFRVGEDIPSGVVKRHGTRAQEALFHRIKTESLFGFVWNKLYRRSFFIEHGILFEDIRKIYIEDQLCNMILFSKNPSYYLENVPVFDHIKKETVTPWYFEPEIAPKSAALLTAYGRYLTENGLWNENMDLYVPLAMRVLCYSLFRNMPYEGAIFRRLIEQIACFLETPEFMKMLAQKENIRQLKKLPSRAQAFFYGYCFRTVRVGRGALVVLPFFLMYPLMRVYIKKTLK